ncbi:MAG: sugar transferase [Bacteroidota bacterium]
MYERFLKRFFDLVFSLLGFLLVSPVFLIIWILLFLFQGRNTFFTQKRPGRNEQIFTIIKFKTMSDERDDEGVLLPDAQRLTSIGKFVRSTSLDELPQLLNVIKGDMSFVGPRPLLPEYLSLYNNEQKRRHEVRPGITGWAQVNGRNAISWEEKFELDVYYVQNVTFALDFRILLRTVKKVFIREGINNENSVTTEAFKGSHNS